MENKDPKEEAKKIISSFIFYSPQSMDEKQWIMPVKSCALNCVQMLINETAKKFWYDVKREIEEHYDQTGNYY